MKQAINISILIIIVLALSWISIIFAMVILFLCVDGLAANCIRYRKGLIPKLLQEVKIVDKFSFWQCPVAYIALKIFKFEAITIFKIVYVLDIQDFTERDFKHELAHVRQIMETGYILFYCLYVIEWVYRLLTTPKQAYENICFEVDATEEEHILTNTYNYYGWCVNFLSPIHKQIKTT